ncbi:MAG: hypothetical protein QNJ40_03800 [Xanthomonadales bacterium]|nr:hypothetical protein [Xanthomonadales bacterium]
MRLAVLAVVSLAITACASVPNKKLAGEPPPVCNPEIQDNRSVMDSSCMNLLQDLPIARGRVKATGLKKSRECMGPHCTTRH